MTRPASPRLDGPDVQVLRRAQLTMRRKGMSADDQKFNVAHE